MGFQSAHTKTWRQSYKNKFGLKKIKLVLNTLIVRYFNLGKITNMIFNYVTHRQIYIEANLVFLKSEFIL